MNLYRQFLDLLPKDPMAVVKVLETNAQFSLVEYPNGSQVRVKGTGPVGGNVFIQDGVIQANAPSLTVGTQDV